MHYLLKKLIGTGMVCGMLVFAAPLTSMAAIGPGFAAGTYVATVTAESVNINKSRDSEEVLLTAKAGSTYEVLEDCGDGWMKVRVNDTEGYLPVSENAVVEEAEEGEIAKLQKEALESSNTYKRQQLVNYALQFVGGPYKYGGSDPRTGVDCSGYPICVPEWSRYFSEPLIHRPVLSGKAGERRPDAAGRSSFLWKQKQH